MMRDHIIGEDYELWDIVTDGPLTTTKKNAEGVDVPKTRADCTAEDLKKWEKNAKAKKWIVCGLGPDEYSRIQSCTTAKKIWDTLQVAHEGTPQVKRSRVTLLYSHYKNFTMKEGETIQEMYTRFTILTNEPKSLGRIILEEDKVEKILTRVLPVSWESKISAIQKSKNITTLKLDELIGNLTTYELRRQTMKMDAPKKERNEDSEDEAGDEQALMAIGESDDEQEGISQIWYMDSGCLKHMTGSKNQFFSLKDLKGGNVSFGKGKKREIIGVGKEHEDEAIGLVKDLTEALSHLLFTYTSGGV
ncbi:uncharacterized protein [Nicotiana sylvestris]|uniref:uncharacterized protein n=1 Tax=Nicotiana sylvestris TaxID=4096 RepID=UPI00388C569C